MTQPTSQQGQIKRSGFERYLFGFRLWNQSLDRSAENVKVEDVIMGVLPFFAIILGFMLLMIAFPQIAFYLPSITLGS